MSCRPGQPCQEGKKRRTALGVLGLMALIFVALSFMSFLDSRGQVVPTGVEYAGHDAVEGKRVFQAYNCMGCHTIVGNGAYLGPDLTKLYGDVGPAWLEAFLPSAGSWPTQTAVQVQLQKSAVVTEADVNSIDAYFDKYPAAVERVNRRSGHATIMPNLPFRAGEVAQLIAFLKYTSQMDTEGWPPIPQIVGLTFPQATQMPAEAVATAVAAPPEGSIAAALGDPVDLGAQLVEDNGCTACHSAGTEKLVGPAWGGLYGGEAELADGSTVKVDDAYLTEAIMNPDAQVAAGFHAGVMPSYVDILEADQVAAIVAYIRSLGGEGQ
ncbi:c-type cytochrome [Aurantimonas sp. C2-6-R+9]|uniref:c-type cytochrome n=1 Tax=unclassified Aurantimonas TaxID=2638230 RepID=UPI002E174B6E|nr:MULTISPECIES: c-type cytochrome [unclassified Aurantimonas]MEC5293655.1 c-type cytochrome [Aurantimonas sp. C2-3-R2]MEC5383841.1 c-type cytochrome [Aurantimonas sp. C2-6-R+9]MEC5414718.1 c-type cytochrome [Aurantimonas sp. C2-4-R8]